MLSPGEWHLKVPKGPVENRQYRAATLRKTLTDKGLRKGIIEACRQDLLFYVNTFVWQFNPLKKGAEAAAPFISWDFQDTVWLAAPGRPSFQRDWCEYGLLWCYEHDRNVVIQKSRLLGATWQFIILQDWLARFHDHIQILNISRNEDAVDDKSPDSLFWKLRFIQYHLPDWLRGKLDDSKMFLGYPNSSVVTGEATTKSAGVGGRASLIFFDEVAKIREAAEVRRVTANTADCRMWNSTHEGVGTEFYRLTQTPEMVQITLHWSQHPEHSRGLYYSRLKDGKPEVVDTSYQFPEDYQFVLDGTPTGGPFPGLRSPWYDRKCVEIGSDVGVATELDINPTGSVSQFFSPMMVRELQEAVYCREPDWVGDLAYDPYTGRPSSDQPLVPAPGGPLRLWLRPDHRGRPPLGVYALGTDVATGMGGKGSTSSCLSGVRCKTGEKVLEYANPYIDPVSFATLTVALCWLFKDEENQGAQLVWERQGPGEKFGKQVIELGYRNVYMQKDEANPLSHRGFTRVEMPGWAPTRKTTRILMEDYKHGLLTRMFINPSREALEELLYWAYKGDTIEHSKQSSKADPSGAGVNHGDRSVADALAWLLARGQGQQLKKEEERKVEPRTLAWRRQLAEAAERAQEEW